ncbi:hypothetical protein KC345_g3647 [Hortaea werneckii]|nr:hypothetical protein KC345_g3647 [Hortaea werneckii]
MAGDSRLRMTDIAKLNDDQEDPDTLEKYLMSPDDLPREPETADGMLVMEMSQGDEEVLFKVPQLAKRAPAAGGCTYAKLVIGKYKGFDIDLSLRRITEGDFVPKVTAGRYVVGGERRLPVNEDLCPDVRLLGIQLWLDTRRDTGLNGGECLQYYKNWLVRVWRSFFPEHPIYKSGRTANNNKPSGPTDSARRKRKANVTASEDDPFTTPSKKRKERKRGHRRSAREANDFDEGDEELGAGGDDVEDVGGNEEDVPNEGEVGDEDEKECEQRYQLSSVAEFWTSYEEDGKEDLDLDDEKVCEMIGSGYLEFKQLDEGDPPPMSVLKEARDEYRRSKGKAGSVEHTFAFRTWNLQMTTGKHKPPKVERLPSLYKVDEANRKKRQQKEELERIEDGQWLRSFLLKHGGVTEDDLRYVDRIASRLNKVDI